MPFIAKALFFLQFLKHTQNHKTSLLPLACQTHGQPFWLPSLLFVFKQKTQIFFSTFFKWGKSQTSQKLALYFLASELITGKRKHRQIKQFCWHHPCQLLANNVKPSCDQTMTVWRELTKQLLHQMNNFICIFKYASCHKLDQAINLVFENYSKNAYGFNSNPSVIAFFFITLHNR